MAEVSDRYGGTPREQMEGRRRASVPSQPMADFAPTPGAGRENKLVMRSTVIDELLNEQQGQLFKLREMLEQLTDAITPVLGPERPQDDGGREEDSPERSKVARFIDDNTDIVRHMQTRVVDMLNRVEV